MLCDYLLPYNLISLDRIPKISTEINLNIIEIDILDFLVQIPISFGVPHSTYKTDYLPDIPPNHQNQYNNIIGFNELAIILLILALIRKSQ